MDSYRRGCKVAENLVCWPTVLCLPHMVHQVTDPTHLQKHSSCRYRQRVLCSSSISLLAIPSPGQVTLFSSRVTAPRQTLLQARSRFLLSWSRYAKMAATSPGKRWNSSSRERLSCPGAICLATFRHRVRGGMVVCVLLAFMTSGCPLRT